MTNGLIIGILGILIVLLVVVPLMSRAGRTASSAAARAPRQQGRRVPIGTSAAVPRSHLPPPPTGGKMIVEAEEGATIDAARIEGKVKASSVKKVSEIVGKHPDEALAVVRSWMNRDR